ncbi:MAG: DUF2292 domain-containing protein [Planctomycetia bacterium]|nr:DUF2292 domain-containing protein [Planctomycetia bacterium]
MSPSAKRVVDNSSRFNGEISDAELEEIRSLLKGLRYGSVQIIVQDGVVVQIDKTEKRRLRPAADR